MLTAALLLAAALAIVAQTWRGGRTLAARVAALAGRTSRRRMLAGWAAGNAATWGLPALTGLAILGQVGAVAAMPETFRDTAWMLGLPGDATPGDLAALLATLALGAGLGVAILWWRGRRGLPGFGLRYRSPAAARARGEWPAAALIALAAGVGEELFFRLLLPLLVAIVTGSALLGFALALLAFAAVHRHQGVAGMIAVGLVGAGLTALYLATGALWMVMLLHVAIDLNALIVRPALMPIP